MKKIPLLLFCIVSVATPPPLFTACSNSKDDPAVTPIPPEFTLSEEDLQFDFDRHEAAFSIPVETNLETDGWQVSSEVDWCEATQELTPPEAAIRIVIDANDEPGIRTAHIAVKSPARNYTIRIRQLGTDPAVLVPEEIAIAPGGGPVRFTVVSNVDYGCSIVPRSDWLVKAPDAQELIRKDFSYVAEPNYTGETRSAVFTFSNLQYTVDYAVCVLKQESEEVGVSDVEVDGDIKITPTGGRDSEHAEGQGIENTFDGVFSGTPYRSVEGQPADFPVTLEYFFDAQPIDYLVYHPCQGEGYVGKVEVYAATESAPDYTLCGSYDLRMQPLASRIDFARGIEGATKIKLSVQSGLGDCVGCDEMEFFRKNPDKQLDAKLLEVFTDILCTELREDATDEKIMGLPGYFIRLAKRLKDGTYTDKEKDFRIQQYEPYSYPEEWADRLTIGKYGNLDNPAGIYVEPGDSLFVLVGDTHGQTISVQCIGEEMRDGSLQPAASGETRFLREGVNQVGFSKGGMLFIMYQTTLPDERAEPVKIHIPIGSGHVCGFFDLKRHQNDGKYQGLMTEAGYKYFCARGEHVIFYFHREKMKELAPYQILPALTQWDNVVGWQQELMGIDDNRAAGFNNHLFVLSHEGSDMWASDYRLGIPLDDLGYMLTKTTWTTRMESIWEPARVIGRIHQRAIDWPGVTESCNTLFANQALHNVGKFCSRGSELSVVADARLLRNQPWWNLGYGTPQQEDVEVHARMFWQLWCYYHLCGYKPEFWPQLFELLREKPMPENDPGRAQLHFAMMACSAANENLTDFFEFWGFFEPVDVTIEQNGTWHYRVTQKMIQDAKAYLAQFPAPRHAFYYLEDRRNGDPGIGYYDVGDVGHYTQFRDRQMITTTPAYSRVGQRITIHNGEEAVAFEIKKGSDLIYFSNFLTFDAPASVDPDDGTTAIYAVQADGRRIRLSAR